MNKEMVSSNEMTDLDLENVVAGLGGKGGKKEEKKDEKPCCPPPPKPCC